MENKPGNLSKFCGILEDGNIDIIGISVTDAVDHSVIRVVVSDSEKCSHLLGNHGMVVIESEVIELKLKHHPGELRKIAHILSKESINIDYIYGSGVGNNANALLFLKVSEPFVAKDLLLKFKL